VTKAWTRSLSTAIYAGKIDIDRPAAVAYLQTKRPGKTNIVENTPQPTPETKPKTPTYGPEIEFFLKYTLRQLVDEFGTAPQFKDYVTARKLIEDIRGKMVATARIEGELISRELVANSIFRIIENSNVRLLRDLPKTLANRVFSLAKAKGNLIDAEKLVRELISTQIQSIKVAATRALND